MNICIISTGYPPENCGGIGTYTYNLSNGLVQRGHHVYVLVLTCHEDKDEIIDDVNVFRRKIRYLPKIENYFPQLRWSYFIAGEVKRLDKKYNFDVVEFPNWEAVGFWYLLNKRRKRVVTRIHTPYFETLSLDKNKSEITWGDKFLCWLERKACERSDLIISSTKGHRSMISKEYSTKEEAIKIIPLGIKLDLQFCQKSDSDFIEILYVSRLENRKGTMILIEAIPKILDKYQNVYFSIVGEDRTHAPGRITHREYFLNTYGKYKNKVEFIGYLSDKKLRKKYSDCDIFVVPSLYESFGLIYVEAMMFAKPVVATRVGGIPEVIEDGVSGVLVQPNNVEELVRALSELIENKEKRVNMGQEGQRIVMEKFDYKIMAKRAEEVYFYK